MKDDIKLLFQEKLEGLGFKISNQKISKSFGDFFIDMGKANLKVRLVSDRSILDILVTQINSDDWVDLTYVISFLKNSEKLTRIEILDQLDFFIKNVQWFLNQFSSQKVNILNYAKTKSKEHLDTIN